MIGPGIVAPLSKSQIETFAGTWRQGLGFRDDQAVNMLRVIELALPQIYEDFELEVVDDVQLGGAEATTSLTRRQMRLTQSTYEQARRQVGRANFTLAHELGHLLMHCGRPVVLARGSATEAFRNPEWQADQFASAFLIPAGEARKLPIVAALAARFGTSPAAARVRLQKLGIIPSGPLTGGAM